MKTFSLLQRSCEKDASVRMSKPDTIFPAGQTACTVNAVMRQRAAPPVWLKAGCFI